MKILLIEPPGGFIRLDRCMQSVNSWGGVYRLPLNLVRIAAALLTHGHDVKFLDLQADPSANLGSILCGFRPQLCILSCGFPSMRYDVETCDRVKAMLPQLHVSTFGVVPTLLGTSFFARDTWGFHISFDSIVVGGEPALGYLQHIFNNLSDVVVKSEMEDSKSINTHHGRHLFDLNLYYSPFSGRRQSYVEGSYGCPNKCIFCVVPGLYGTAFAKRSPNDIVREFQYVIENNGAQHISLWDEGTTFQRTHVLQICEGLIDLRKSRTASLRNFSWNTRSTTALVDEETAHLLKRSGLTGLTLGLESFDNTILDSTRKGTSVLDNERAIKILTEVGIKSIGHIVLGLPEETNQSAQTTIEATLASGVDFAQFYCAVPYPGTALYNMADQKRLIRERDLTKYELCNPIMDTLGGLTHIEVGLLRSRAMQEFYAKKTSHSVPMLYTDRFRKWSEPSNSRV